MRVCGRGSGEGVVVGEVVRVCGESVWWGKW